MKIGDLVEVIWDDHCTLRPNGWIPQSDVDNKPSICRSVGWVVGLDRRYVTLTATFDQETQYISGYMTRLRSAIIKSKVLKGLK